MRKRQIIFILFLIIIVIGIFSLRLYSIKPSEVSEAGGVYAYSFNKVFSRADLLSFVSEDNVSFLELYFSNNRVLRYVRGSSGSGLSRPSKCEDDHPYEGLDLPRLSRWKDPVGRTRVAPVVIIECDLNSKPRPCTQRRGKSLLAVGKDYIRYAGSITRGMRLEKVVSNVRFSSLEITNFKRGVSIVKTGSFLTLTDQFPLRKVHLAATIEDSHVQTWEYVYPSSDGEFLVVSSFDGYIYFLRGDTARMLWNFHLPDGKGTSITISSDNKYVFAGEHSADGNVYCLDAYSGKLVWKYSTAQDVGSLGDTLLETGRWAGGIKPNVREVICRGDLVFIRTRRRRIVEVEGKRKNIGISKIYAFDRESGQIKWTYPKKGRLEGYRSSVFTVSDDGKYASWALFDWEQAINPEIFVFDAQNGKILWQYQCDTVKKYFKSSSAYQGGTFSPDSSYMAVPLNDGRILVFNNKESVEQGKAVVRKIIDLSEPIEAGTIPVMTYMTKVLFTCNNDIIVLTGNTYTTPFAETKLPPLYHPNATSLFCLDLEGNLLWRFTSGGNPSSIDLKSYKDKEYLVFSSAHNVRSQEISEHGVHIFDLTREGGGFSKVKSFYHTDGICVNTQLSPDLSKLFAIEAVIDMDETPRVDYRGKHRLLFFRLNDEPRYKSARSSF